MIASIAISASRGSIGRFLRQYNLSRRIVTLRYKVGWNQCLARIEVLIGNYIRINRFYQIVFGEGLSDDEKDALFPIYYSLDESGMYRHFLSNAWTPQI